MSFLLQDMWEGHQESHLEILGMFPQEGHGGGNGAVFCGQEFQETLKAILCAFD